MNNQIIKVLSLSVLVSSLALGASVPNIGDIQKQIITPKLKKEKILIPQISTKEYKSAMKDSGKTLFIKAFTFSGNNHVSTKVLQDLVKTYKNKDLTFTKIAKLTSIITKYYRQKGYFVARAYLPKQKIMEGILEINIIEGNYGIFKLNNNSLVKNSVVQAMLNDAKRDNIVSTDTLERSMLIINDTTGVIVKSADVMPGVQVGTSDFAITTQATKKYDGYILIDNTGSRYTDKNRLRAGVNINSPFKIGDKISLSGLISQKSNLNNIRAAYTVPLMPNGLKGELSYSQTSYSLVEKYKALDAKGASTTLDASISYAIKRTRLENVYVNFIMANKDLKDEVKSTNDTTKKNIKSLSVGLDYDKAYSLLNLSAQSSAKFALSHGKLSFEDSLKRTSDKNGANTNGNYSKINIDLSHNMQIVKKTSLQASLKMQYALGNKNLDGSEDFSIGGAGGVKVYPSGELSAENGYLFNIETKYQLENYKNLSNTIGVFYDRGKAFMANNNVGFESKTLQDIGLGYYANYKDFFGQVQIAFRIDNEEVTSEANRNSRVLFQGGWTF